jgi:hypothetical protein
MLPKELGHLEKDEKKKQRDKSNKCLSHLPKPKEVFFVCVYNDFAIFSTVF